jgi:hypothetical protein
MGLPSFMAPKIISEISRLDFQDLGSPPAASITDVKHLSSYNWVEASTPTIIVPGSPPLWSAPNIPLRLKKDSGLVYIAQNAARHPESPLEPLFRALYITNPSFDIRSVDIVTDRNNIRKLLSFVDLSSARDRLEAFTITVEVAGNTVIFCRDEAATQEFISPHEFRGFGHEFEKRYTTSQIRGSTGHHRIISYRFGGLNFIVRHETDGYVDGGARALLSQMPKDDPLSALLESLSLSPADRTPDTTVAGSKLSIREEGDVVPLESTLEIKTRVAHKPLAIQDVAPQLWVSQTPKLVRAYHTKGVFQVPKVEDVAAEIKHWEDGKRRELNKLAALIKVIITTVKSAGGNAVIKYDEIRDNLVVYKNDGEKMLPQDLYAKWDVRDKSKVEVPSKNSTGAESAVKSVKRVETRVQSKSSVSARVVANTS